MTNQFSSYQKEQIASLSKEGKGISQILRTLDSEGRKTSCATVRKWVNWWEKKKVEYTISTALDDQARLLLKKVPLWKQKWKQTMKLPLQSYTGCSLIPLNVVMAESSKCLPCLSTPNWACAIVSGLRMRSVLGPLCPVELPAVCWLANFFLFFLVLFDYSLWICMMASFVYLSDRISVILMMAWNLVGISFKAHATRGIGLSSRQSKDFAIPTDCTTEEMRLGSEVCIRYRSPAGRYFASRTAV